MLARCGQRIVNDVNMKISLAVNLANKRMGCRVGSISRVYTARRFCDKVISIMYNAMRPGDAHVYEHYTARLLQRLYD